MMKDGILDHEEGRQNNRVEICMQRDWITHTLQVGMENGTARLENSKEYFTKLNLSLP